MLAAERGRERDVLVTQAQGEGGRLELAGQELVDEHVEGPPATAVALAHRLPQELRRHPGLHPHAEHLGQHRPDGEARAVVDELGHRARADRPDVVGLVPHRLEQRPVPVEHRAVPAHPDRQPSRPRPDRPAAHRRVEYMRPARREQPMQPPHQRGRIGAEVEERAALAHAVDEPLRAESDLLDLGRARQRGEHDLRRLRHRARRVLPDRARGQMRGGRRLPHVVHDELVPGGLEIRRHASAHGAETDESDLHWGFLPRHLGTRCDALSTGRRRFS